MSPSRNLFKCGRRNKREGWMKAFVLLTEVSSDWRDPSPPAFSRVEVLGWPDLPRGRPEDVPPRVHPLHPPLFRESPNKTLLR